jgi:hypothetical protein
MPVFLTSECASNALQLVNALRREVGEPVLRGFPRGTIHAASSSCPLAKALTALILPEEHRIVFCYPWHASAATKAWRVSFTDTFLMSVHMPAAIYDFAVAFRRGLYEDLVE